MECGGSPRGQSTLSVFIMQLYFSFLAWNPRRGKEVEMPEKGVVDSVKFLFLQQGIAPILFCEISHKNE